MAQTTSLISTLKKALKAHGKTYADVALRLQLTEASVKRLFSEKSFSLQRLDQVCQMLDMEISDLVRMMNDAAQHRITQLTEAQEQQIVGDVELLLVAVCVLNRWTLREITDYYAISEPRGIQKLAQLDRLKLIELLPKNRVKLLVAPNFSWRKNGPIQQFFQEKIEADFFSSRFDSKSERLIVINGMLSNHANAVFQRKLGRLAQDFDELNNDDAGLPFDQKRGHTVVLAIRPWKFGLFDKLRKNNR